jgi:hypothetical protein
MSQIKLASLTMATGDPREAAVTGSVALDAAGAIRSNRAVDDLRDLARHGQRHRTIPAVEELRHRITTLVLAR